MSRTINDLSVWHKPLIDTYNIVRLAEPISRCQRTQVFKIEGFVCKRFLPSPPPPPSFIFWLSFHFSRGQNRSFFAPKPNGNAFQYAGYLVHFFSTAAHFHFALVAASISYFVTAATKFSCYSVALFLVELPWPPLTFTFSLSFSCSIFQICGQWIEG